MSSTRESPVADPLRLRQIPLTIIERLTGTLSCGRGPIELAVMTYCAGGHLLIEDVPGTGKTTLARALAACTGARMHRIQFTSDMLPSDLTGVSVLDRAEGGFRFVPGPLFCDIVLADEINRANPKAQAAMLEAMEERSASVDGVTHPLPDPFFVIATQNPIEMEGTYPLPEAELDRFMARCAIGYPNPAAERRMLMSPSRTDPVRAIRPVCAATDMHAVIAAAAHVHVSEAVADYAVSILAAYREHPLVTLGPSPRAGLALLAMSRARAWLKGQDAVWPGDVRTMAPAVLDHRIRLDGRTASGAGKTVASFTQEVLSEVAAPSSGTRRRP